MDIQIDENPENLIIPLELSKIIINYDPKDANLTILDKKDQVYGKALDGDGNINFKNGNKYIGELHNGMLHGQGKFIWTNGVTYEGSFYYNSIQGKGKYNWPDGSTYEGDVVSGLRDGLGKFVSPNSDVIYEGEWKDGKRQGKGKLVFKSGAVYEGDFFEGQKHGKGTMTYPSQNYYEGEWSKDKKEGFGTMFWLNSNEKYYGQWKNNKQNGFGVHIWLESKGEGKLLRNRYQGQWKEGQRHGYGIFYYANGSTYKGEWKNNLKDGYAIFTEDNGNIIQCQFKADRMLKEEEQKVKQQPETIQIKDQTKQEKSPSPAGKRGPNQSQSQAIKNQMKKTASALAKNQEVKPDPQQQQQQLQSMIQEQAQQIQKKKEIEINPYIQMIDINDLTENVNDDVQRIHRDAQNMLLRHNSLLKQWYKLYSNKFENSLGENAFAMDLSTYWKFIKEAKVCDSEVTLAAIDRLFCKGAKNRFEMHTDETELKTKLDLIKRVNRQLDPQELNELVLIDLVLKNQPNEKLNWNDAKLDLGAQAELLTDLVYDMHSGNQIILFRHFVELIVRTSYIKYGNIQELHRSVENLIELKLKPQFQRPLSSTSEKSSQQEKKSWGSEINDLFRQLFENQADHIKSAKFGVVDETIRLKSLIQLLKSSNLLDNDSVLLNLLEKSFDQESQVSHIDQLQKEDQINWKKRQLKIKDKKAQQTTYVPSQNFEKMKAERVAKLYDTELIRFEFQDLMLSYLFKYDKELASAKKDEDVIKKLRQYLTAMISAQCPTKSVGKPGRIWPTSEKDKQKEQLAQLRQQQKEEALERKRKEEERKREQIEKARMELEALERTRMEQEDVDVGMQSDSDNQSEDEKKKIKMKNFRQK